MYIYDIEKKIKSLRDLDQDVIQNIAELLPYFDSSDGEKNMPEKLVELTQEIMKLVKLQNLDDSVMASALFLIGKSVFFKNSPAVLGLFSEIGREIKNAFVARQYLIVLDNLSQLDFDIKKDRSSLQVLKFLSPGLPPWNEDPVLLQRVLQGLQK